MRSILCPVAAAAGRQSDAIALIEDDRRLTFRELNKAVSQLAELLRDSGVEPGDRLAIVEQNRLEYALTLFALFRIGAVACLFNHHLGEPALEELMARVGCSARLAFAGSERSDPKDIPTIEVPRPDKLTGTDQTEPVEIEFDQPATIMTTSGSSGSPKLVLHNYGNHWYSALGSNTNLPVGSGDRWLISLSLFHVGGLAILFRCLLGSNTAVIGRPSNHLLDDIRQHRITHISVVPTQLRRLLADIEKSGDSRVTQQLKAVLLGGSPIDKSLLAASTEAGLPLYTSYGLTEMASQVCTSPPGQPGVLKPLEYRQVCVSDESEILVKGETLFQGYVEGNEVKLPLDSNGWFHTGDLGRLDRNRGLIVTGRKDNMFLSGGENIHPEEIERHLMQFNEITDAVVVPVRDAELDFRPVAFLLFTSPDTNLSEAEIKTGLVEQGLPGLKIPVAFLPWPRLDSGHEMKLNREVFKKEAERVLSDS